MKRIFVKTIPLVGAISLAGCTPIRSGGGGNSGDDDDSTSGDPVVGSWELRTSTYGETTYDYPTSYEYEGCTTTNEMTLDLVTSGGLLQTYTTTFDGTCEYSAPYISTYSGTWELLSNALYRIRWDEDYDYNCSLAANDLACANEGLLLGFRRL